VKIKDIEKIIENSHEWYVPQIAIRKLALLIHAKIPVLKLPAKLDVLGEKGDELIYSKNDIINAVNYNIDETAELNGINI